MNLDSLSFALSQISCLVASLNKKNHKQVVEDLAKLVSLHGLEADRHLLQCLFAAVDFCETSTTGGGKTQPQPLHAQVLLEHCGSSVLNRPFVLTAICCGIERPLNVRKSLKVGPHFFPTLSKCLRLSAVQEVVFALALSRSETAELASLAHSQVRCSLPALVQSYVDTENSSRQHEGGLHDTTPEVLHIILSAVLKSPKEVGLTNDTHTVFLNSLQRDFPKDLVPVVLAPLVYPDFCELAPEMTDGPGLSMLDASLADLVAEMGYSFTVTLDDCRNYLAKLGRDVNPASVARCLSLMCKMQPHDEQVGGWNVDVFVQALKDVAPSLQWKNVVLELDNVDFIVKDRQALILLMGALRIGLQNVGFHPETFPVDHFYRRWSNVDGQFSLIQTILKNPDVFCFADYPFLSVPVDILKTPPEQDGKELANWRNVNLVELLLAISECGLYQQTQDLFKLPLQNCPDVLVLTLMQITGPVTMLRQELFTNLIPIFLGNHANSAIILHHAWHTQTLNIKHIIMHAMAEWYARGDCDQTRLSRILDVAQDLKALSMLLNAQTYPFIIDLACLASRREYLKLEKWLTDKIREHGETFVTACLKFLQRRCPQLIGKPDDSLTKATHLPKETLTTMLLCLQTCSHTMTPDCQDSILQMAANCTILLKNHQQQQQQQQPPSSILRSHGRNLDASVFYNDPLTGINSALTGINLGPTGSAAAFNLQGGLGPLVSSPGSPPRLLGTTGPSNSPFSLMSVHQGPVGTASTLVPSIASIGSLSRIGTASIDKPRVTETSLFPEIAPNVSKDIEDEANSYFQRIYNHPPHPTLSIDEVLDMLKKFQDSPSKREKEVFNCMLRNLFEEYRFFPQYPDKELHITAQLFGGIIERGLVSNYMALGLALRFVLDALRKQEGSKMYYFGIAALDRFKSRLKEYHKYCEHVRAISHFAEFPPHLIEYIEYGLMSQEPPNKPQGPVLPASLSAMLGPVNTPSQLYKTNAPPSTPTNIRDSKVNANPNTRPSIANATNIDTLLVATEKEEKVIAPPENLQDKTAFIFNNLSQLNLQSKCDELREIVSDEFWPWISQYLVMKRASIELNFHVLYSNFLDTLKMQELYRMVTKETFRNIKVLLRSDKGIANFSDRSLLKNLGHWLGMLTLGRNKPILQIDIDIKSLIVEAYHKGQQELLYVIPFVAKVLESCSKSKVFKPPNPWTMAIMNVLAELHQEPELKLNLKFEIEVLCRTLDLDITQLKPSIYLKDSERLRKIECQLSQPAKKEAAILSQALPFTDSDIASLPPQGDNSPPTTQNSSTPTSAMPLPPEPRFNYVDIQLAGNAALQSHITISPSIVLFQSQPHLKPLARTAIERAVQEWIHPVVDRAIKIALTTCEQLVRKDFALDSDETRMRSAAHCMVRYLTGGMVMITCRDQLLGSINTHMKSILQSTIVGANSQQKDMIEQAANIIAQDNMELTCVFIQKTAIEKALPEIDKRLQTEFEMRKIAKQEGRRYCDAIALTFQAERMPEPIRLKVGGITQQQMAVYEEFANSIPGFLPLTERDAALFIHKPSVTLIEMPIHGATSFQQVAPTSVLTDEVIGLFEKLALEVEQFVQLISGQAALTILYNNIRVTHECIVRVLRNQEPHMAAVTLIQKCVEHLQDPLTATNEAEHIMIRYKDLHIRILKVLQDPRTFGQNWTNKQVSRCVIECRDDLRYNVDSAEILIRAGLVNLPQFDLSLAQAIGIDGGINYMALTFAVQLVQVFMMDDRSAQVAVETDLPNTVEVLSKLTNPLNSRALPDNISSVIELLRQNQEQPVFLSDRAANGPSAHIHNGILQVRSLNYDDPPGLMEKTDFLLRDWISIYHSQPSGRDSTKAFSMFVHQMNIHGILKTDDLITRFFRLSTQLCVEAVYRNVSESGSAVNVTSMRAKSYHTLDPFVRLIALLVKHSGDSNNTTTKIHLLNKVLGIVAGCLLQDHEQRTIDFQQLPYHRIFIMLFLELCSPEPVLEAINYQVLTAYCHTLHILRPSKAAGFCYAWLELISHRVFIGRILAIIPQQKGWNMYAQLLIDLFKYLAPFLRNAELAKPVTMLYQGTLRVLLVLLHDFPEFLCDYHYGFCDVIPPNCIQMRNLILSAFPRNMRLPDPFTPNLKVDILQEIAYSPRVLTNFASLIVPAQFKVDVDSYIKMRGPVTFLSDLRSNLQVSNEPGMRYNIPLMNALVMYVGTQAIQCIRNRSQTPNMTTIAHGAHMDIFQNLAVDLDTEGRYLFLNAIANQLRYPNSHTHYFSCTLLYLFAEANTEAIQEQITRVLLERLIVNRPHPWGLLITFIELIKNPTYKFWSHEFVHCAPEIEKLFDSVARSCMVQKTSLQIQENDLQE